MPEIRLCGQDGHTEIIILFIYIFMNDFVHEECKSCAVPFRSKGFHTAVDLNFHVGLMQFKNGLHSARLGLGNRIDNTHFLLKISAIAPCLVVGAHLFPTRVKGNRRKT